MIFVNNDRDPAEGFLLCQQIPTHSKADCYDAMGKWMIMYYSDKEQRNKVCSVISQEYYKSCADASLDGIKLL